MDDAFFKQNFNTQLSPEQEGDYKLWLAEQAQRRMRDVSQDEHDYDMRGFFKSGTNIDGDHFPDTYKKPNHPTFSAESIYHGAARPDGGKFMGGAWGEGTYTPSPEMLQNGTHNAERMRRYFQQYEPDVRLLLPK